MNLARPAATPGKSLGGVPIASTVTGLVPSTHSPQYRRAVAMFLVVLRRSGPEWRVSRRLEEQSGWQTHASFMDGLLHAGTVVLGGPLADEHRVVLVVESPSEAAVRATLADDPWSETHLQVDTIDPWTIRLDGRRS